MIDINEIPKFVINLDKRFDRLARFNAMAKKAKLGVVTRFRAYEPKDLEDITEVSDIFVSPTLYACGMSHLALWHNMIENDWPYIMIFEDDAMFTNKKFNFDLLNKFGRIDMLMLGGNHSKYGATCGVEVENKLYRCTYSLCGHAYVISKGAAEYLIKNVNYKETAIDVSFKVLHEMGHSYYIHPSLYVQMPDYSDIWLTRVNYMDCIN
jgi:GR25 family glycosyltransferase involved in LPS biosynthesis